MKNRSFLLCTLFLPVTMAFSATYYIDFEGGDNLADGISHQTAWKHSPGDRNAKDGPASAQLQPGDILHFKGGVQYFGEIRLKVSGSEGRPIVLDGNTDGSFGAGPAILDGAQMITGWQRVSSAEQVGGNPRWKEIMVVDLDVDLSSNFSADRFVGHRDAKPNVQAPWQRIFLIDGERRVLPVAQRPKPSDSFYPDLPSDFYKSPHRVTDSYPHKLYYEEGSKGNSKLPLIAITYGGNAPIIEPFNGGAVSVEMKEPATIVEIGFTLYRPKTSLAPNKVVFLADGKKVYTAKVDPEQAGMQRFKLPRKVKASKLTFQLQRSGSDIPAWTKLQQIAAFTADDDNVIEHEISSVIQDEERLTKTDPNWYDGMFIGVHGGNNHVYFSQVREYDSASNQLCVPHFESSIYDQTKYALYNSPKLIDLPGEWCLVPLEGGRTRAFLLPERMESGQPVNIGYPVLKTAVVIEAGASNLEIRGFLMQRYAGGSGGVATSSRGNSRSSHIRIADCEVRFMSGQSGISLNHSEYMTVENCYIHHCPGWTVGIYMNRINHFRLSGNRLYKNSGSGIRHYESKHGVLENNQVLDHYGMHSSALNFYEGCSDILFTSNYVQKIITINRSAENLTFRNNVVDSENRNNVGVALWKTGKAGGTFMKNILFENNTFINTARESDWGSSIFVQGGASAPEDLVIRNNILDNLRPVPDGIIEGNILMRDTATDPNSLFVDPAAGDYRRKKGGPQMDAGANISPPSAKWTR